MAETSTADKAFTLPGTEDMETWRTVPQFLNWIKQICDAISVASDECRQDFRVNKLDNAKKFREEFLPFAIFVQIVFPRNDSVEVRAQCGSERLRDFEIRGINPKFFEQIQRVEITYAVGDADQGKVENERWKIFNDQELGRRHVPAHGDPNESLVVCCTDELIEDLTSRIVHAIQNKLNTVSNYTDGDLDHRQNDLPGVWLLVAFDDMLLGEHGEFDAITQNVEKTVFDMYSGKKVVAFSRVWLVGCSSRKRSRLIYQKDEQKLPA